MVELEQIYQKYFQDVYRFLRSISADADMAEEIAQETFVKAMQAIDRFDGQKDIRAWLFTIARNTYYTYCKRQKIFTDDTVFESIPAEQITFAEKLVDEESAWLIHHYLHQMDEPYKEVFTLRVFGELPFAKIGRLFGKTPNWARVTFYRAKKQIIEHMEESENDEHPL